MTAIRLSMFQGHGKVAGRRRINESISQWGLMIFSLQIGAANGTRTRDPKIHNLVL